MHEIVAKNDSEHRKSSPSTLGLVVGTAVSLTWDKGKKTYHRALLQGLDDGGLSEFSRVGEYFDTRC